MLSWQTGLEMLADSVVKLEQNLWDATSLAEAWAIVVQIYSRTRLTCDTDKLIAIAGVAEWFSMLNKDEYIAGLWRQHLEVQLLWYAVEASYETYHDTRPSEYIAPSWSWASTRRRIQYKAAFDVQDFDDDDQTWTQNVDVLQATTELTDSSFLHGALTGGLSGWRSQDCCVIPVTWLHRVRHKLCIGTSLTSKLICCTFFRSTPVVIMCQAISVLSKALC